MRSLGALPLYPLLASALLAAPAAATTIDVHDDEGLRAALRRLGPGVTVRLAPGEYRGGLHAADVAGAPDRPAVLEAADPERPPVIVGGQNGLHLSRPAHVVVRGLVLRGATGNGLNVDDGGRLDGGAVGVVLERLRVERVGPTGNHDAIKLSGVTRFVVRGCVLEGWGGSGVDMVGCHDGLIEGCRFEGLPGCSQANGVQAKGGTSRLVVRRCTFVDAGPRAINVGGSTGLEYFRPPDADCEARDITVEGCRFRGSDAPIAFVGVDGALVRRNTFVRPRRWVLRILQERTEPRFVPCRGGRFEENVVVFRRDELSTFVNVGPGTAPETFRLARNAWFAEDAPARSRPDLPAPLPPEEGGTYGVDPRLQEDLTLDPRSPLRRLGADAFVAPDEPRPPRRRR
ncbi:MAG: right-handed parallel beta-helix repeat-containing protein [Planctomycetes bacterium]|nr:right-handed parallel beta-helix repeat-containing protein [Planctomycetota bacterium]